MTQKFYEMTPAQRRESLIHQGVDAHTLTAMAEPESPSLPTLDVMSENVVGAWQAPLGILTRCLVNRRVHRVAMSTEEPSVVAAANKQIKGDYDFVIQETQKLGDCSVVVSEIETQPSEAANMIVIQQIPDAGTNANRGDAVKLIVSGGCGWGLGSLPRFSLWEEVMEEVGAELNAKK